MYFFDKKFFFTKKVVILAKITLNKVNMKCIVLDDDKVSRLLVEKYIKKTKFLELLGSFETPVDALNFEKIDDVELVFVDIEMPEMSGLEFIKSFKKAPYTIVISAKDIYAVEALNLDALDYLLKPIEYARFLKAVNKVKDVNEKISDSEELGIFIKDGSTNLIRLKYSDIAWVEALENYVLIVTEEERHTIHFTMKSIENQFPDSKFARVHRSYIVNLNKIKAIEDNTVIISYNGRRKDFPLAKSMRDNILKKIKVISK